MLCLQRRYWNKKEDPHELEVEPTAHTPANESVTCCSHSPCILMESAAAAEMSDQPESTHPSKLSNQSLSYVDKGGPI